MQNWRAVVDLRHGRQALIVLGDSQNEVVNCYHRAFFEVIHPDVQSTCERIYIQMWHGKPTKGNWITIGNLRMP